MTTAREAPLDIEEAGSGQIADLRSWAQVFHEVHRDGAVLVHDRERLRRIRDAGGLPVVTIDATPSLNTFERESPLWLTVLLRRPPGRSRSLERAAGRFTLAVRADLLPPAAVAHLVHHAVQAAGPARATPERESTIRTR